MPRPDAAYAVAEIHAIKAASALHGAIVDRKYDSVSLAERHDNRSRLHTGALLGHHELAACEVVVRFRQQNGKLERKDMLTIEVLVQTVVIIGSVPEQKRRRSDLAGVMATLNEIPVLLRIADIDAHRVVPAIGDRDKPSIN